MRRLFSSHSSRVRQEDGDPENQQTLEEPGAPSPPDRSASGIPTVFTHVIASISGKKIRHDPVQSLPRAASLKSAGGSSSDPERNSGGGTRPHGYAPPVGGAGLGVPHGEAPSDGAPRPIFGDAESDGTGHWDEHASFRAVEDARREVNNGALTDGRLFLSHCWRMPAVQRRKRRMVAQLSLPRHEGGPGLAYWADWLDLQASGPVPWVKEIEEGIQKCSKMVCFVDEAYLKSYNCLTELAYCIRDEKPIVVIILDQESWELLTVPGGVHRAWSCSKWGTPLSRHNGEELPGNNTFDEKTVGKLFSTLAAINLCPCRPLEESNWGMEQLLRNMAEYVCKDIAYMKEHATLKTMATQWDSKKRPNSLLLHQEEAYSWSEWVKFAKSSLMSPMPSELQVSFVKDSVAYFKRKRKRALCLAAVLVLLIIAGAIASAILAVKATAAEEEASKRATVSAMWTGIEKMSDVSGAAPEIRLLVLLLGNLLDLGKFGGEILHSEVVRLFYKVMGLNVINSGTVTNLEKSWGVAWSPDNSQMAYAAELPGNPVFTQSIHSQQAAILLGNHTAPVHGLSWHADGRLAAADQSGMVTVYDVATQEVVHRLDGTVSGWDQPIFYTPVSFSPSGTQLVTSSGASNSVRLWDLTTNTFTDLALLAPLYDGGPVIVSTLAFSPSGALVVSRTDGLVSLLESLDGPLSGDLPWRVVQAAPANGVHSAVFSPGGDWLAATLGGSQDIFLYALSTSLSEVEGSTSAFELSCDVLSSLESAWTDKQWNEDPVQTQLLTVLGYNEFTWTFCNYCKNSGWPELCVTYGVDNLCPASKLKVWDNLTAIEQMGARVLGYTPLLWNATSLGSFCSGYGPMVANHGQYHGPMVLGAELSNTVHELGSLKQKAGGAKPTSLAVSPDVLRLSASSEDGLLVWDLTGDSSGQPLNLPAGWTNAMAWSPNGQYLAAVNAVGDASIWDFQPQSSHLTLQLPTQRMSGTAVAFSYAGDMVVSGGSLNEHVEVHDPTTGQLSYNILPPAGEFITQVAFSKDDAYIAMSAELGTDGTGTGHLLLYDVEAQAFTSYSMPNQTWANGVAYHPQDNKVAVAVGNPYLTTGRMVQLWDLDAPPEDGPAEVWEVPEMPGRVGFSPGEGRFLASSTGVANTNDKSAYVWDLQTGQEVGFGDAEAVGELFGQGALDLEWSPASDPDEPTTFALATSCQDRTVRVVHGNFAKPNSVTSTKLLKHEDMVYSVRWSSDGRQLVSAGKDGRVYIWSTKDLEKPVLTHRLSVGSQELSLSAVAVSPAKPHLGVLAATGELHRVVLTDVGDMAEVLESLLLEFTSSELTESDRVALEFPTDALEILMK